MVSEQERAKLAVAAQLSDGSTQMIPQSELAIQSLNASIITVEGEEIIPIASGSGPYLLVTWTPATLVPCDVRNITKVVYITVALQEPEALISNLTAGASQLASRNNPAAILGIPLEIPLAITALYPNGESQDVTDSSLIEISHGPLISIRQGAAGLLVVAASNQHGNSSLTVRYRGLTLSLAFEIVSVNHVQLEVGPYPVFPGSQLRTMVHLNKLSTEADITEQGALHLTAVLSSSEEVDVSGHEMATFTPDVIVPSITVEKQNGYPAVLSVAPGTAFTGTLVYSADFAGVAAAPSIEVTVQDSLVAVLNFSLITPNDTLVGVSGSHGNQLSVDFCTLNRCYSRAVPSDYPGLFNVEGVELAPFATFLSGNSTLIPVENSASQVTISLSTAHITSQMYSLFVNLVPGVGDADVGGSVGPALADVRVGDVFTAPVYVNTGPSSLGAVELMLQFSPGVSCVCACVCACVRACVCVCMCACVRVYGVWWCATAQTVPPIAS